jgi:hypothetical protein
MKGLSLPINVLVIVVVAIIVLLGVVAIYFGGWSPFSSAISVEGVKNALCEEEVREGCDDNTAMQTITTFDANKNGQVGTAEATTNFNWASLPACTAATAATAHGDNLASICYCYYGRNSETLCRRLCGCP